jgi:hypothetical protein
LVTAYDTVPTPDATPEATPDELTVTTDGVAELHTPPLTVLLNTEYEPTQTAEPPVIDPALAAGLTVISCVTLAVPQLLATVYDIVAVPAVMPVTTPEALTVILRVAVAAPQLPVII